MGQTLFRITWEQVERAEHEIQNNTKKKKKEHGKVFFSPHRRRGIFSLREARVLQLATCYIFLRTNSLTK